jgi:hypothetical protein
MNTIASVLITLALALPAAAGQRGFDVDILVDGVPRPQLHARGAVYVEALRGREYTIRLTNPLPCRVAVALAVDGLNSIDARHTDARNAAKWVLDPFESVEIPGWQVSGREARRFVFTGERGSYGAWLGETDNLGVIEAVFFREKTVPVRPLLREGAPAPVPGKSLGAARQDASALDDDLAATGMGAGTNHRVQRVELALERKPAATVRLRYEYRPELIRLGVLAPSCPPLDRRERAEGFSGGFCPQP